MAEFLIVMRRGATPRRFSAVLAAIGARGGKVTLTYPPRLILAQGDDDLGSALRGLTSVTSVHSGSVDNVGRLGLEPADALAVRAWNQRASPEHRARRAARPDEGQPWDYHRQRPGGDVVPVEDAGAPTAEGARRGGEPTSSYLIGTVAVGVVIVDGPVGSPVHFTSEERTTVVAEVQEGAAGLVGLAPANARLSFAFDVNAVALNLDPNGVTQEEDWRDTAMAGLGFAPGSPGMYDYLRHLRTARWPELAPGPDWAYIAFFTKYAAFWFAYASIGGPRMVMQYHNNGWGSHQIDRVFAHETGHIFGAPDEYASSNCSVGGSWGHLGVPNDNCEVGNPGSVSCLMKGNTYDLCASTLGHFGWRDSDLDGVLDPDDADL